MVHVCEFYKLTHLHRVEHFSPLTLSNQSVTTQKSMFSFRREFRTAKLVSNPSIFCLAFETNIFRSYSFYKKHS